MQAAPKSEKVESIASVPTLPVADVEIDLSTSGPSWCWTKPHNAGMRTRRPHEARYALILLERYFLRLIDVPSTRDPGFPGIEEMRTQQTKGFQIFLVAQHLPETDGDNLTSVVKDIYPVVAEAFDRKRYVYYINVSNRGIVYGPDNAWALRLDFENRLVNGVDDVVNRYGKIHELCVIPSDGKFTFFVPPTRIPERPPHPSDVESPTEKSN